MGGDGQLDARGDRAAAGAALVIAHVGLLFYLRFWVNPAFIYYWPETGFPDFLMRSSFFERFVGVPGGMAAYATAFLSQFFCVPWAGAAVTAAVSAVTCLATGSLIRRVAGRRPTVLHLWPAALVGVCYAQYSHVLPVLVAVGFATLAAAGYARVPARRVLLRALAAAPASFAVYYVAGGGFLVFVLLCILVELRRRALAPLIVIACAAAVVPPLVGMVLMHREFAACFPPLLDFRGAPTAIAEIAGLCLFAITPACLLAALIGRRFLRGRGPRRRLGWILVASFLVVAGSLVASVSSRQLRILLELEYACENRQWVRVLRCAQRLRPGYYMPLVDISVNLALYHSGTMGENLFLFPQQRFGLLRSPEEYAGAVEPGAEPPQRRDLIRDSEILYDLGRINEAEHTAGEALQFLGARPWVLERLAMIKIVKEDYEAARTFLLALRGDLFWRARADRLLACLERDPDSLGGEDVRRLRTLMVRTDEAGPRSVEDILRESLAANGSNRMAFEYLMADYMLKGRDLDALADEMHRLDDLGYERIPRLYEEALLVRLYLGGEPVDLGARTISIESRLRFADFLEVLGRHPDDPHAALSELDPPARFSFMAYYFVHLRAGGRP